MVRKQEMMDALDAAGIEYAANANIAQLQPLYDAVIAAAAAADAQVIADENAVNNDGNNAAAGNGNAANDDAQSEYSAVNQSDAGGNDEELDALLARERRRNELLMLQQQNRRIERELAVPTAGVRNHRLTFGDIEYAIMDYTGDDRSIDIRDFLKLFEDILTMAQADESFKLLALRRKLKGAANCLTKMPTAVTYEGLKKLLLDEFGNKLTVAEAERMLRSRKWKRKDESLHQYVLEMQTLRLRMDTNRFTETEFVDLVIDGLNETRENTDLLRGAKDIRELKDLTDRYKDLFKQGEPKTTAAVTTAFARQIDAKPKPAVKVVTAATADTTRCFNCSMFGHIKENCPYENRPTDACFKCWGIGHRHNTCTNPKKQLKLRQPMTGRTAAAAMNAGNDADEEVARLQEAMNSIQTVSVAFLNLSTQGTQLKEIVSLFDTGSPISFIRKSHVPYAIPDTLQPSNLCGLGGKNIQMLTKIDCRITFHNQTENVTLVVLPNDAMMLPLILGRDFLKTFRIFLSRFKLMYSLNDLKQLNEPMPTELTEQTYFCALSSNKLSVIKRFNLCKTLGPMQELNALHGDFTNDILTEAPEEMEGKIMTDVPQIFAID